MPEILKNILYIVITGCGTAATSFLCAFITKKIGEVTSRIKNTKVQEYIMAATDVVANAVLTVSQTYVDALKKEGTFTPEAQIIAKAKAIEIATKLITEDGKNAIETVYGDFTEWLNTKIESDVKTNKEG